MIITRTTSIDEGNSQVTKVEPADLIFASLVFSASTDRKKKETFSMTLEKKNSHLRLFRRLFCPPFLGMTSFGDGQSGANKENFFGAIDHKFEAEVECSTQCLF